ncbi:MAG: 23S rRNA (uracil(1939)-C(5))-methyltransferase RlmD [Lachnospiraceae bacterium]|nr:23S rRNA (uracil(1939)-C(5))-methyltransferase RlmD [Lachnospiraceae bacterium]
MKKNDEFEIEITDMSTDGEGIGHADGMAFFVKGAVIGDVIIAGVTKLKKTYGYARIVRIVKPSPNRVKPACTVASRCGGCALQQVSYPAQLEFKQKKVIDALTRIGGIDRNRFIFDGDEETFAADNDGYINEKDEEYLDGSYAAGICEATEKEGNSPGKIRFYNILGMQEPLRYRNKGQFPIGTDKNGNVLCGFYATHSHDIIDTKTCLLQHDITDALMAAVREYMDECGAGAIRHILTRVGFTTHEVMVCAVIAADELPHPKRFAELLGNAVDAYNALHASDYCLNSVSYNINKENTNVILGEKVVTIAGLSFITDYIGDIQYQISPLSFYQVNPVQTEELYATALEFAAPDENDTVWDLYCGIGTISLYFTKYVKKVYGIEIVPQAIEDAIENAKLNGITNTEFMCGAAEELFPKLMGDRDGAAEKWFPELMGDSEGVSEEGLPKMIDGDGAAKKPDIVIVDPPRKGCDAKLIECIGNLEPRKIVYVSCDPATLARDIKLLGGYGYEPLKIRPVDMFPHTVHTEVVTMLVNRNAKKDSWI